MCLIKWENNILGTQLSIEVAISNLEKSRYKGENAELDWLFSPKSYNTHGIAIDYIFSQSLSLPHMGNGVHFFLLTHIAYLIDYEFHCIGWFLIGDAETRFQAPFQPHIGLIFFKITKYHTYHSIDN